MIKKTGALKAMKRILGVMLLAAGVGGIVPLASAAECGSSLYQRRESLQGTLLATRDALDQWRNQQSAARAAVQWGPWHTTLPLPVDAARPATDLSAKGADGKPLWHHRTQQKDGQVTLVPPGQRHAAATVYQVRTVTAADPVTVTVGIGGGDRIEVWLNDQRLCDLDTQMQFERYGCGMASDQIFPDQYRVDLPLPAGTSRLLVRIAQQTIDQRFPFRLWFSSSPNPIPHLWQNIRRDFPPHVNPLLEAISHVWFENDGWLAATDTRLEREFVNSVLDANATLAEVLRSHVTALESASREIESEAAEPRPDAQPRWLDLCVVAAEADRALSDLSRVAASVEELGRGFPECYPSAQFLHRVDALRAAVLAATTPSEPTERKPRGVRIQIDELKREALVRSNPLLKDQRLVFARRYTYDSRHYYDDYYAGLREWGGNLCELDLATGNVREIVRQLDGGIFDRYDLSADARRIVFGYRAPAPEGFRIWEVGLDGSGLRQLTFPPADEAERIARHNAYSAAATEQDPRLYGHWTDDMHPCYLPDGRIVFVSSRSERTVLCGGHALTCTTLYRIDADGQNLHQLSQGALTESTPTMLDDGRILYTRWEYVYKGIAAVQSLWAVRPDGTGAEEIYGHNIDNPGVFFAGRQIPGRPDLIVATGCGHEPLAVGSIQLIDRKQDRRTKEAMTSLTPGTETRGLRGFYQFRNGKWHDHDINGPFYCDPFPLADPETHAGAGKYFLVSHNPHGRYNARCAYGIYLMDAFGNCVLVYDDPEMSCFQPMVLAPRPEPRELTPLADAKDAVTGAEDEATVVLVDLYRNLEGVEQGAVKYLRVLEQIPRSWAATQIHPQDAVRGQQPAISLHTHIWVAVLLGIVPVEPDGSACFQVPADRNIFFQALDENFMEVQKMRTFVNFQPGETRSCVGCHDPRASTQVSQLPLAMLKRPAAIEPQPGDEGPRAIHYPADVQPIFDRHCVRCHGGEKVAGDLDLSGTLTTHFNRSYEELIKKGFVPFIQEWTGPDAKDRGPYHVSNGSMLFSEAVPPYTFGSHRSKLIDLLRNGHEEVELNQAEFVKLVTWIDANAPFYGSYFGRRHISAQGRPDFRPTPTLDSARGIEPPPTTASPLPAKLLIRLRREVEKGLPASFTGTTFASGESLGNQEAVSVSLWVRPDALSNRWNPLLFTDGNDQGAFHFSLLDDGAPNVAINTGGTHWVHQRSTASVETGRWQHVVVVCDPRYGGTIRFYVDGEIAGTRALDLGQPLDLASFRIGAWDRWEKQPRNNFQGMLEDVRIYHGLLTDEEIGKLAAEANRPTMKE